MLTEEQSRMAAAAYPGVIRYLRRLCWSWRAHAWDLAGVVGLAVVEAAGRFDAAEWRGDFDGFARMVAGRRVKDAIDALKVRSVEQTGHDVDVAIEDPVLALVDVRDESDGLLRRARLTGMERWAVLRDRGGDDATGANAQRAAAEAKRRALAKLRRAARGLGILEAA